MFRIIWTLPIAVIAMAIGTASVAAERHPEWEIYAHPQRLVDIGGRRLNLYCLGKGSPTVILDGGLGDDITTWRDVQSEIAAKTKVCAYDRAGYGFSDPGPFPRTAAALVADLDSLLRAAKLPGPYVVVGQSLGGLHIRLFADRHRRDVMGMVLIDPSFEHQVQRYEEAIPSYKASAENQLKTFRDCIEILKKGTPPAGSKAYKDCIGDQPADLPPDVVKAEITQDNADNYRTALSELESFEGVSSDQIDASRRSYGAMKLVVLSASIPPNPDRDTATRFRIWYAMHEKIAHLAAHGVHRIVPNSTHHIQESRPDVVIAAVEQVIDEARQR